MNRVQYASTRIHRCPMHDDRCAERVIQQIGLRYSRSSTGEQFDATKVVEEACGRFTRGKHIGKLRGWANIEVVEEGGWMKDGPGYRNGHVVRPGRVLSISITDFNGKVYFSC